MTRGNLRVCLDARGTEWQLGRLPPARGRLMLLGWRSADADPGGGVPADIAGVLARAFTAVARVTFAVSSLDAEAPSVWTARSGGDLYRASGRRGATGRLIARLSGIPPVFGLCSTTSSETARQLFEDGGFPWWLQGQVVVLTAPDGPPPEFEHDTWLALLEDDWLDTASALADGGLLGTVRPGVDGAVAGLLTWRAETEAVLLAALERETHQAGLDWAAVPESDVVMA